MIQSAFPAESPPLRVDQGGAIRVGESNVLLELVVRAFQDGATVEAIVNRYATLTLADTYAVIAHYLRHRKEVEDYLSQRERHADEVQQRIQASSGDMSEIRSRLASHRQA